MGAAGNARFVWLLQRFGAGLYLGVQFMKKLISILAAAALLLALVVPCGAAEPGKLTVKGTAENGSLLLTLSVEQNPGIIAAGFEISYDTKVLALTKTENGEIFNRIYVQSQNITDEPYRMLWADVTATADHTQNGVLAKLTFKVLKQNTAAEISVRPMAGNIFNKDLADRDIAGCAFILTVQPENGSSAGQPASSAAGGSSAGQGTGVKLDDYKQLPVTDKVKNNLLASAVTGTGGAQSSQSAGTGSTKAAAQQSGSATAEAGVEAEPGSSAELTPSAGSSTNQNGSSKTVLYAVLAAIGILAVVGVVIIVLKKQGKAAPQQSEPQTAETPSAKAFAAENPQPAAEQAETAPQGAAEPNGEPANSAPAAAQTANTANPLPAEKPEDEQPNTEPDSKA